MVGALAVPLTMAATAFGSAQAAQPYQHTIRVSSRTPTMALTWSRAEDDSGWSYHPELITPEQVRDLKELLATPYTNDIGFEYFRPGE
jgi:hypothetical protein